MKHFHQASIRNPLDIETLSDSNIFISKSKFRNVFFCNKWPTWIYTLVRCKLNAQKFSLSYFWKFFKKFSKIHLAEIHGMFQNNFHELSLEILFAKTLKLTNIWSWMAKYCVIGKTIWELRTVRHPNRVSVIGTRVGSSVLLNKNPISKSLQWTNQMSRHKPSNLTQVLDQTTTQTAGMDYYMNTLFKVYTL